MPRLKNANPKYRHHRGTGQAIVTFDGKDIYLGPYGKAASRAEYDRLLSIWLANGRRMPQAGSDLAIVEVADRWMQHADLYYRRADGTPTSEVCNYRQALRPLLKLFGRESAAAFGPVKLEIVRNAMIESGLARRTINHSIARIKLIFRWAVSKEMIPASVDHALVTVKGLRGGRSNAKETEPVRPVPEDRVHAIKSHVSRQVWAMIMLQWHTGMRSGEVTTMRGCDIDTTGAIWQYKPAQHKTLHHGHRRIVQLGPKSQEIIRPFLKLDTSAYIFSPADAEQQRRQELHEKRLADPKAGNRIGTNRKAKPSRQPGARYTTESYCRAIARGCDLAFVMPAEFIDPRTVERIAEDTPEKKKWRREQRAKWRAGNVWHPHQLRHSCATQLEKQYGIEAARCVLGHRSIAITQLYAETDSSRAAEVMRVIG